MPVTRLSMKTRKESEERKKKRCKELIVKIDDITTKIRELTDEAHTLIKESGPITSINLPTLNYKPYMLPTYVNSIHTGAEGICMAVKDDYDEMFGYESDH